ncbi:hypothetical protein F5877DRAFT_85063 [Lentinula edodes]|nr:hypothetical protein F5877DRAFT_85063 [Lentinula edodes]
MSTSRTTTTTHNTVSPSRSRPAIPPPPATPVGEENEDKILRRAHERVRRIREQKAAAAAKKKADEEAAKKVAEEARKKKVAAARELEERRRLMAEAATAQSQRGTSPSEMSISPRRPVVELRRAARSKGKGKAPAQPVGGDPDDGNDGDDDDDDEDDRAPCERCKSKKLPCQMQAGKRSLIICKPCHDAKVRCSYSGHPTTSKQREGGSGERIAVMESQMAQSLADLWALREADSKTHQYLRQLLRRQEDDHARLIAVETRMAMMGMGEATATAGPSRRNTGRRRPLKRRRIVEESGEEEAEEEDGEVEEKEKETEQDGEGEVEGEKEGEAPARAVASEKGKEKEVVE